MNSPTLFDPVVRDSDPATSHAAAATRASLELDCLSAVRAAGWVGANTDEVWAAVGRSRPNVIARRLTTLCREGAVVVIGTRPGDSGRQQQVFRAVGYLGGVS